MKQNLTTKLSTASQSRQYGELLKGNQNNAMRTNHRWLKSLLVSLLIGSLWMSSSASADNLHDVPIWKRPMAFEGNMPYANSTFGGRDKDPGKYYPGRVPPPDCYDFYGCGVFQMSDFEYRQLWLMGWRMSPPDDLRFVDGTMEVRYGKDVYRLVKGWFLSKDKAHWRKVGKPVTINLEQVRG